MRIVVHRRPFIYTGGRMFGSADRSDAQEHLVTIPDWQSVSTCPSVKAAARRSNCIALQGRRPLDFGFAQRFAKNPQCGGSE